MSLHIFSSNFEAQSYLQAQLLQIKPKRLEELRAKNIIVVPTKSLVRYFRNNCYQWGLSIGFQVLTIAEFAVWILLQHDIEPPRPSSLFSFLVREKAQEFKKEDFLQYILNLTENEEGSDGLVGIETTISELFKSGFDPSKIDLYLKELDAEDINMIRPILHIAAKILAERKQLDSLGNQEELYWQVIEALKDKGAPAALSRVFFYGLQDATSIIASFMEILHQQMGEENCYIFLHKTLDPLSVNGNGNERKLDSSNQIVDEFLLSRLLIDSAPQLHETEEIVAPKIQYARAVGRQAELRRAIQLVLQAVEEEGMKWEDCAIVARDLTPYVPFIRSEVEKTGIPISLETPLYVSTPSSKRIQGFLRLLQQQEKCDIHWFLSIFHFQIVTEEALYTVDDIQRYVREENCHNIQDLLNVVKEDIESLENSQKEDKREREPRHYLRIVNRITEDGDEKGKILNFRKRRYLPLSLLQNLKERLASITYGLFQLERIKTLERQEMLLMKMLDEILLWRILWEPERMMIYSALKRLQQQIPRPKINWFDTRILLRKELKEAGKGLLDQKGEGIRLFSAMDAVGMTFSYLVILGVNRDVFPQSTTEDPILNRKISVQLRKQLPGFTLRERKYLVERHLLYWLICSAKKVLVSWLIVDDKGNEMAEAPLIRRLLSQEEEREDLIQHVPSCFSASQKILASPIVEQICLLGIRGDQRYFDRIEQVLHWGMKDFTWLDEFSEEQISELAMTIKKSLQLKNTEEARLSVYDGMVGRSVNYPQLESELFVTRIEGVIQCPWQSFLVKVLGIPDRNQLNHYPSLQSNDIGTIVHAVLEDMVDLKFTPEEIEVREVEARLQQQIEPRTILWPRPRELDRMILARIDQQLDEIGIHFKGYREVLLGQAKELLETSYQKEFHENQLVDCLGAEVEGKSRFQVQGLFEKEDSAVSLSNGDPNADISALLKGEAGVVQCKFKADRVDLKKDAEGNSLLYLVDYKTGRPIDRKAKKAANDKAMRAYLRKGQKLQIPIYTSCYQGLEAPYPAKGELFFLKQGLPQYFFGISSEELKENVDEQDSILEDTGKIVASALAVRSMGTFFPTIGGDSCKWCQLRETCRYRDNGFARKWESTQERITQSPETIEEKIVQSILNIRGSK